MSAVQMQGQVQVLDLHFQTEGTVAAFLVPTQEGPVLVETGPESLFPHLQRAVEALGHAVEDIRHVFVTHIHLDHAGAAWRLARHGAKVYVHPKGVAHLQDPGKLYSSAQRIYGEAMERLWGRLEPIDPDLIVPLEDGQKVRFGSVELEAVHTPGHASHHITYRREDGLFTGDVGGVRIGDGPVIPPFPPPDIDLEAWAESLRRMRACGPRYLYPTHFGIKEDAADHFDSLEANIHRISSWVEAELRKGGTEAELIPPFGGFIHDLLAEHGVSDPVIREYEIADPAFMSVQGLSRYWNKRASRP
jgi:glyoxylase-like metal-dependent hydrolase (beta-lactamase superfamily II)